MLQQTVIRVRGSRPTSLPEPHPEAIPANATLYNGPSILYGTYVKGVALTWLGEPGPLGTHYAAVWPDDPDAAEWHSNNQALGAVAVQYVSDANVREAVDFYLRQRFSADKVGEQLRDATPDELWRHYLDAGLHFSRFALQV